MLRRTPARLTIGPRIRPNAAREFEDTSSTTAPQAARSLPRHARSTAGVARAV